MKKIMILTLVLLLAFSSTAFGALKVLPPELEAELTNIAVEAIAKEKGIDVSRIEVNESWVQEFFNIDREIFNVYVLIDKDSDKYQKASIAVDVKTRELIDTEGVQKLLEEDYANAPDEPVFRTLSLPTTDDQTDDLKEGEVDITSIPEPGEKRDDKAEVQITGGVDPSGDEKGNPMRVAIPAFLILAVGGFAIIKLKK